MRSKQTTQWYDVHVRDERSRQFYQSAAWRGLRDYKLSFHPLCELCSMNGKVEPADMVHHIVPITTPLGWDRRLDLSFLQSLCHACHNVIEAELDKEEASKVPCLENF